MSRLLFDTLPLDFLIQQSKYYLNKKFEFVFKGLSADIRKIIECNSLENLEIRAQKIEINDLPLSWYCLNVLQSLSVDKPSEDRIDFIKEIIKQTDSVECVIDFSTHKFKSNGFKYEIPINLNQKLNLDFGNYSTFQTIKEYDEWENHFIKAIELIKSINPSIIYDLNLLVKNILVVKSNDESHGSMSPKSLVGTIYLPDIKDAILIAECLIHECLHQYLYRIEFTSPLFLNSEDGILENYYSPWKDYPRPLIMVLHGAFVFTGVTMYYSELCRKELSEEYLNKFRQRAVYRKSQIIIALNVLRRINSLSNLGNQIIQILDEELKEINIYNSEVQIDDVLDHFNRFSTKDYTHVAVG